MVKVRVMNHKGDERQEMKPEELMELMCKLGKSKHFVVDGETQEIIHDIGSIRDDQTITIIPKVSGGSQ